MIAAEAASAGSAGVPLQDACVRAASDSAALRPLLAASMALALRLVGRASDCEHKLTTLVLWGSDRVRTAAEILFPVFSAAAAARGEAFIFDGRAASARASAWYRGGCDMGASAAAAADASAALDLLISAIGAGPLIITLATPLGARRPPPVAALVHGAPRAAAAAKDSAWVTERHELEVALEAAGAEEALLVTRNGEIYEGTQTNFFALAADGTLETAPDGDVLAGTVRRVVLEVAEREGLCPVVLRAPKLADARTWRGAFLTSTSRLVMPIDTLLLPATASESGEGIRAMAIALPRDAIVARLEALTLAAVDAHSEDVERAALEWRDTEGHAWPRGDDDGGGEGASCFANDDVSASIEEVRGGVSQCTLVSKDARGRAVVDVVTLEGRALRITLTHGEGALIDEGHGCLTNSDSLHGALMATSARFRSFFMELAASRLH